ncbi:transglycosylase SLT domain-containing protein [Rhodococcus opacus]|uniref:Transglycosylase SLT domain-containing protein n=1 Tax=Rhodococcus opacus TaxID=37919 RepID=A0A2S8JAY1_RHOOP|nr:transglycosylase SLT domain-containing protein [Rhodococcus opacus]PQP24167.1 hypothetical protein C5613_14905 [Rhodococcus opacus]
MSNFNAGSASVQISPNLDQFVNKLRGELRRIDAELPVDIVPDLDGFSTDLASRLGAINARMDVEINPDMTGFSTELSNRLRAIDAKLEVEVSPDFSGFGGQLSAGLAQHAGRTLHVQIVADTAAFKAQLAALSLLHHSTSINVQINNSSLNVANTVISNITNNAANATSSMSKLGSVANLVAMALAAVAAVNMTPLIAATTQIVGLLGIVPFAVGAAVAGLGTLALSLGGVGDALKAQSKMFEDSATALKEQASLQDALASAQRSAASTAEQGAQQISSAEESVQRAKRGSLDAEKNLTKARKDAKDQIDDLNDSLKGSALSEQEAEIGVERAYQRMIASRTDGSSALDQRDYALQFERSKLSLEEAQKNNKRTQEEAAEANKAGVEGSEQVTAAKQGVADAAEAEKDAQDNLLQTQRDVARANEDAAAAITKASEALNTGTASATAFDEAMAKLSPSAQAFVRSMADVKDAWRDLKVEVQENFFGGLGDSISQLSTYFLPTLSTGLGGIARELGTSLSDVIDRFMSEDNKQKLDRFLLGVQLSIDPIVTGIGNIFQGFLNLASGNFEGAGGFHDLATKFETLSNSFVNWTVKVTTPDENGNTQLGTWIDNAFITVGKIKDIVGEVFALVGDVIRALNGDGTDGMGQGNLDSIKTTLTELHDKWSSPEGQEAIRNFFADLQSIVDSTVTAIQLAVTLYDKLTDRDTLSGQIFHALFDSNDGNETATTEDGRPDVDNDGQPDEKLVPSGPGGKGNGGFTGWLTNDNDDGLWSWIKKAVPGDDEKFNEEWADQTRSWFGFNRNEVRRQQEEEERQRNGGLTDAEKEAAGHGTGGAGIGGIGGRSGGPRNVGNGDADPSSWSEKWSGLVKSVGDGWTNTIKPSWDSLVGKAGEVGSGFLTNVKEHATGAWTGLRTGVSDGWTSISSNFESVKTGAGEVSEKFLLSITNGAVTHWSDLPSKISSGVADIRDNMFAKLHTGLDDLKTKFSDIVIGIGGIWSGIQTAMADPINWVINNVVNGGIGRLWNGIRGIIPSLGEWHDVAPISVGGPDAIKRAEGGGVWGPGGPKDDKIPAWLSNGEHVWTAAEVQAAGGHSAVEAMRRNTLAGNYSTGGPAVGPRKYAIGGDVQFGTDADMWMAKVIQEAFPDATVTSALRPGHSGFHGKGQAVDIDGPNKQEYANWIYSAYPESEQLIWGPGPLLYNVGGNMISDQAQLANQVYAGDLPGHFDHVHWANDTPLGELSEEERNSLWSRIKQLGGSVISSARNRVADLFETPLRAIGDSIPDFGPSGWGQIPRAAYTSLSESAINFIRGVSPSSSTSGDVAPGSGPVVDQVRAVFAQAGWGDGPEWDAMQWIIGKESGWDPTATNPSSGAFGLFQLNPSSGTLQEYLPDSNPNPAIQAHAGLRYIKDRYGSPSVAKEHWEANNWYDDGGVATGIGFMAKNVLDPERVLSPEQTKAFDQLVAAITGQPTANGTQPPNTPQGGMYAPYGSGNPDLDFVYGVGQNFRTKGADILTNGALGFFGLEGSVLSPSNPYNQAFQQMAKENVHFGPPPPPPATGTTPTTPTTPSTTAPPNVTDAMANPQIPGGSVQKTLPYTGSTTQVAAQITNDHSVRMETVITQDPDELRNLLERRAAQQSQAFIPGF